MQTTQKIEIRMGGMSQSNDLEWFSSQLQMNVINNKSNFAVNQHETKCGTTKTYNLERSNSLLGVSDFRDVVLRVFFLACKVLSWKFDAQTMHICWCSSSDKNQD